MKSLVLSIPSSWPNHFCSSTLLDKNSCSFTPQLFPEYQRDAGLRELHLQRTCSYNEFPSRIRKGVDRKVCRITVFRAVSSESSGRSGLPMFSLVGDSLYKRISELGDPNLSVFTVLQHWINEGRGTKKSELQRIVKQLRKYRRYKHALEAYFSWSFIIVVCGVAFSRQRSLVQHGYLKGSLLLMTTPSLSYP